MQDLRENYATVVACTGRTCSRSEKVNWSIRQRSGRGENPSLQIVHESVVSLYEDTDAWCDQHGQSSGLSSLRSLFVCQKLDSRSGGRCFYRRGSEGHSDLLCAIWYAHAVYSIFILWAGSIQSSFPHCRVVESLTSFQGRLSRAHQFFDGL